MDGALKKDVTNDRIKVLNEEELMGIEGGFAVTGSAIIGGVLFVGGVALGAAWAFAD
ncbi:class IIb bacteriocin, lactobin A/cerein 7B family [Marinilactibacillus psychrotolerans]|uniref:Class IIb bacteriocin, lactobin A/cerein 7B family n=1 Tax=Marinilactibacillus psychrotolerans 42ea TaxID=1255609 RepID=A0A1R4J096_9LACT|nr:class IIb bacteriocin, lactobin A/cerein 7B family [Marinilactibacillus psychrotolerans]SJN25364.1 hypothetical protein FM115_03325 [Marinilactibacillus psychrotolerans 42ea]